jgi:glutamine amidotransferase
VRFSASSPLNEGLGDCVYLYHVHSFVAHPVDESVVLARAQYGEHFTAVVAHGNIYGAQSHPEKSSASGLGLLENFTHICAARIGNPALP